MPGLFLSSDRQDEILQLLARRPRMGKELALEMDLTDGSISRYMLDLCRAGLVTRGYSLTAEGRRKAKGGAK